MKTMIRASLLAACLTIVCAGAAPLYAASGENIPPVEYVLKELEKRYTGSQYAAEFLQESTIKTMEITDFAQGRLYVRHPGMMRWEYQKPERQVIVTDGRQLWIFRPQDNLVMTGSAPAFFRDGKGASFLSDIGLIRRKFQITMARAEGEYLYELRMTPIEQTLNISEVRLFVTPRSYNIVRIVTVSPYGDDTRIDIINPQFNVTLEPSLFSFDIPPGADVQKIDE
ncbi:MAG: outer membrane lipoprotein carrier protein LolA [Desulfobacterales bacterium]|jgi:outer membrane lipoprotein carrier protein|nr:outer membrane lipoprotein carrier protein LolA [Desulfobacterales bacterium]